MLNHHFGLMPRSNICGLGLGIRQNDTYTHISTIQSCNMCTQVNIVLREGEALEVPDFDDIYASDMVSYLSPVIRL